MQRTQTNSQIATRGTHSLAYRTCTTKQIGGRLIADGLIIQRRRLFWALTMTDAHWPGDLFIHLFAALWLRTDSVCVCGAGKLNRVPAFDFLKCPRRSLIDTLRPIFFTRATCSFAWPLDLLLLTSRCTSGENAFTWPTTLALWFLYDQREKGIFCDNIFWWIRYLLESLKQKHICLHGLFFTIDGVYI